MRRLCVVKSLCLFAFVVLCNPFQAAVHAEFEASEYSCKIAMESIQEVIRDCDEFENSGREEFEKHEQTTFQTSYRDEDGDVQVVVTKQIVSSTGKPKEKIKETAKRHKAAVAALKEAFPPAPSDDGNG